MAVSRVAFTILIALFLISFVVEEAAAQWGYGGVRIISFLISICVCISVRIWLALLRWIR